ncbi:hypothetical protein BC832DRAFT_592703 [Gaertneriomyces semiglobifer]|nr:hypothetical protein BC832DRAFT_592703 [Gaertneriomyces semiglobifer]
MGKSSESGKKSLGSAGHNDAACVTKAGAGKEDRKRKRVNADDSVVAGSVKKQNRKKAEEGHADGLNITEDDKAQQKKEKKVKKERKEKKEKKNQKRERRSKDDEKHARKEEAGATEADVVPDASSLRRNATGPVDDLAHHDVPASPTKSTGRLTLKDKKKEKKVKKATKETRTRASTEQVEGEDGPQQSSATKGDNESKASTTAWNDWSKASFEGNDARKDKFLRLLGAKKAGIDTSGSSGTDAPSAINANFGKKIENDMLAQFAQGQAMQQKLRQGKRMGLGF